MRRATEVFEDYVGQTLQLDLDRSEPRALVARPAAGRPDRRDPDAPARQPHLRAVVARTPRTSRSSTGERRRNIAVYASQQKLATRGPFYSEDELVDYDVLRYDIDAAFAPDRLWVDGNARIKLKMRSPSADAR